LKKCTQAFLKKSFMKEIKYLFPLKDSTVIGPQRFFWTNPSCSFVWYSTVPGMRSSDVSRARIPHKTFFINFILGSTHTIPFLTNSVSPPKCKWPNWKCHIIASSPCQVSSTALQLSSSPACTSCSSSFQLGQSNDSTCPSSIVLGLSS